MTEYPPKIVAWLEPVFACMIYQRTLPKPMRCCLGLHMWVGRINGYSLFRQTCSLCLKEGPLIPYSDEDHAHFLRRFNAINHA
mgnify:CR=1 FL=1